MSTNDSSKRNKIIYKNCNVNGNITDIEVTDGVFSAIGPTEEDGIDLNGADVFPGLIDIHCHGSYGYSIYGVDDSLIEDALKNICAYYAKCGITTWYPTTAAPAEKLQHLLSFDFNSFDGANIGGLHLEGPYLSPNKAGAIHPGNMRLPNVRDFDNYEKIKFITVAPELEGAIDYIKEMSGKVRISLGHTCADYDTTMDAIKAGASCLNHTFNAMPPLHHRDAGPIGAAISSDIYAEAICDGIHLHPSIVKMLYRTFGKDKMIMVSDTVAGAGLPDGEFVIDGKTRVIKDGVIKNANGNLAGSWCNLFEDVKRAISFGIPREDAYYMASTTPANYMGINKGRIEVGYDADFIVVTKDNELLKTVIGGEIFKE